jgi:hypothetical protein
LTVTGATIAETDGSAATPDALHFLLVPGAALDQSAEAAPAAVRELYRTPAQIPDLKPGSYELNLTRVTLSAADAVKPTQSPLGRGALLHPLRYRRQHGLSNSPLCRPDR